MVNSLYVTNLGSMRGSRSCIRVSLPFTLSDDAITQEREGQEQGRGWQCDDESDP